MFALLLAVGAPASADELVLRNNEKIQGIVLGADAKYISFLDETGAPRSFLRSDVISLQVTEAPQALVNRVAPAGSALAIPAGTPVTVRTIDAVDSRHSAPGGKFRASVEEPLVAGGQIVVPKGAPASLQLTKVDHAGALKGKEAVSLRLQEITIADRPRSVITSYARLESPGKGKKSLVKTATFGAAGAAVGAIAGGGAGALIGAGVGGAAGLAVSAAGKSRVKIKPETRLVFVLRTPVPVEDPQKTLPASGDQEPVKP